MGVVTVRDDKSGKPRNWIKIAEPDTWQPLAQYIWTQHGGTLPEGFILHHLDENSTNDDILNLALVCRAAHVRIHYSELAAARVTAQTNLPLKDVTCGQCAAVFKAKYQKKRSLCEQCKRERRATWARNQERLRSAA